MDEYNALLEQLHAAVQELAKQEREGAWRMMAMQVAHEIKNPLTPIKLGAQQLERAWLDQKEDFDERLRRYTRVVVEQIDILAEISLDFSMLAAVGLETLEAVNWAQKQQKRLRRSMNNQPPNRMAHVHSGCTRMIDGSKGHLTRAMNNLIANAIDAVTNEPYPSIAIGLEVNPEGKALLTVEDNGIGIPEDKQKEIFQPHFTSKAKGHRAGPVYYRLYCPSIEWPNNVAFGSGSRVGLWFGVFREIKKGLPRVSFQFHI